MCCRSVYKGETKNGPCPSSSSMFATDCMNFPIPVHSNSSKCDNDVRLEVVVCVLAGLVAALALTVVVVHWFRHGFWKRTNQRVPNCNCKNKSSTTVDQESKLIPSSAAEDVEERMDTGTAKYFPLLLNRTFCLRLRLHRKRCC